MKLTSILLLMSLFCGSLTFAQTVYKTPSGNKYHSATCRYVKNVSKALSVSQAQAMGLSPCSKCLASGGTEVKHFGKLGIKANEAKGTTITQQCKGRTKSGKRCSHRTRNKNGYCFQHEAQY